MDTWFSQYIVPVDHRCWNSMCDCAWRQAQLDAYKPNRQTLYENYHCWVTGSEPDGSRYVRFVGSDLSEICLLTREAA